jgi:hypothetical protein
MSLLVETPWWLLQHGRSDLRFSRYFFEPARNPLFTTRRPSRPQVLNANDLAPVEQCVDA